MVFISRLCSVSMRRVNKPLSFLSGQAFKGKETLVCTLQKPTQPLWTTQTKFLSTTSNFFQTQKEAKASEDTAKEGTQEVHTPLSKEKILEVVQEINEGLGTMLRRTKNIDPLNCCYHPRILLVDNIRGQSFDGIIMYKKNINLLNIICHLKFVYCRFAIDEVRDGPVVNSIRMDWRLQGMKWSRLVIRYIPDKLWLRDNMNEKSPTWISGVSTYYLDQDGKVTKHVIDPAEEK